MFTLAPHTTFPSREIVFPPPPSPDQFLRHGIKFNREPSPVTNQCVYKVLEIEMLFLSKQSLPSVHTHMEIERDVACCFCFGGNSRTLASEKYPIVFFSGYFGNNIQPVTSTPSRNIKTPWASTGLRERFEEVLKERVLMENRLCLTECPSEETLLFTQASRNVIIGGSTGMRG